MQHSWTYIPNYVSADEEQQLLSDLKANVPWEQHRIRVYGKEHDCPRLSAWYGDAEAKYAYSQMQMTPLPWRDDLQALAGRLAVSIGTQFNSVLLNYYRDGRDSMGCHSDDEVELGQRPIIASLNLGAERDLVFHSRTDASIKEVLSLEGASLLIMHEDCQQLWTHELPKRMRVRDARINLTFRYIMPIKPL